MIESEEWQPVPGWEGLYEVSSLGCVRSLPRQTARGVRGGKLLKLIPDRKRYLYVALSRESQVTRGYVHQLVLLAFHGPREKGMESAHEDGDNQNNRATNLSYKTKSGNMQDSLRHGTNRNASKDDCPRCGDAYSINGRGQRYCKSCRNAYNRSRYAANPDAQLATQRLRRAMSPGRVREIERASKQKSRAKEKVS